MTHIIEDNQFGFFIRKISKASSLSKLRRNYRKISTGTFGDGVKIYKKREISTGYEGMEPAVNKKFQTSFGQNYLVNPSLS